MNNMPEKIYATKTTTQTGKERWWHEQASLSLGHTTYHRDDIVKALEAQNKMLAEAITAIKAKVVMQADDEGLWFYAKNASEGYLQQELRKLHEAIETHAEAIALAQRIGVK